MRTTSSDLANGDMVGNPQCENPEKYQTGKTGKNKFIYRILISI